VAQRVGRGIALLFHDRGTRRGEWSAARPGRTLPPGKTRYQLYRRLGGPQGRSGWAENLVLTGIRSRTVQPVAQSLYRLSYYRIIPLKRPMFCPYILQLFPYNCISFHPHWQELLLPEEVTPEQL
jgi:hypothetical protein